MSMAHHVEKQACEEGSHIPPTVRQQRQTYALAQLGSPFYSAKSPVYVMVLPTVSVGLLISGNTIQIIPHT